jgi:hypothetical protein
MPEESELDSKQTLCQKALSLRTDIDDRKRQIRE